MKGGLDHVSQKIIKDVLSQFTKNKIGISCYSKLIVIITNKILRLHVHSTALFNNFAVIPLLFSEKKKIAFHKRDSRIMKIPITTLMR